MVIRLIYPPLSPSRSLLSQSPDRFINIIIYRLLHINICWEKVRVCLLFHQIPTTQLFPRSPLSHPTRMLAHSKLIIYTYSTAVSLSKFLILVLNFYVYFSHSLPESPPDSGSEPPYSPQDGAVHSPRK